MFKLKPSKIETRENISQQQTEQKEKTQSHCVTILLYLSFFFFKINVTILFQGYCSNSKSNWIMQPIVKECSFSVKK